MRRSLPVILLILLAALAAFWVLGNEQPRSAAPRPRPDESQRESGSRPEAGRGKTIEVPATSQLGRPAEPEKAFKFKARLVDTDGKPIANALCDLWLMGEFQIFRPRKPARVTSNTDGILELRLNASPETQEAVWDGSPFPVPDGWLSLTNSGFYKSAINDYFAESKPAEIMFTRGQSIRGQVLDANNKPVAGANIAAMPTELLECREMLQAYCSTPREAARELDELDALWIDDAISIDTEEGVRVSCVRGVDLATDDFAADEYKRRAQGVTDAEGNFELSLLPKGQYCVQARHELGLARTTAESGGAPVVIVLATQKACTLEIELQWWGEIPEQGANVDLRLGAPFEWMTQEGFQFHWDGTVEMGQRRSCTVKLGNVPAGDWKIRAGKDRDWDAEIMIQLRAPGAKVRLFVGPDNKGTLIASAEFGGEPLADPGFRYRQQGALEWERPFSNRKSVELVAGGYEVICGSPEVHAVEIKPGEVAEFTVGIPSKNVQLQLSKNWNRYVLSDAAMRLVLHSAESEDCMRMTGETWPDLPEPVNLGRTKDEFGLVPVRPGECVEYLLAPGIYSYGISFKQTGVGELYGVIDLRSPSDEIVVLDPLNLPDIAILEVAIDGYLESEDIEIRAFQMGQSRSVQPRTDRFAISAPETNWGLATDVAILQARGRYFLWARPGDVDVYFKIGESERKFRAKLPGTLHLNREDMETRAALRLINGDTSLETCVDFEGAKGLRAYASFLGEKTLYVATGEAAFTIAQSRGYMLPAAFCRLTLNIPPSGISVDVSKLEFTPMAALTVRCLGRRECWWNRYRECEPLLQRQDGDQPPIELCDPDELHFMPQSERIYRDRALTPGRYTITPWPNAPKSACKAFEIKPGEMLEIVLEG